MQAGFLINRCLMKTILISIFGCCLVSGAIGCTSNSPDQQENVEDSTITNYPYKSNLLPGIFEADSAYILFYDNPGDHRFYKTTRVTDKKSLEPLMQAANETIIPNANDCITQGKIHFYAPGGKVYTLYFSRADSCMSLSFIHTGEKYFTHLPKAISSWLYQQRDHSIE